MAGQIDIVNAALMLVGAEKLTALTDASKSARLATAMFDIVRDEIFEIGIDWNFAIARSQLSQLSATPAFGYNYQYQLPSGCLRVLACVDEGDRELEFEWRREVYVSVSGTEDVETDVIACDEDELYIKYLRRRTNCGCWPAYFTKLVYLNLALLLCEPLKQDKQKYNQIAVMFDNAIVRAEMANARENVNVSGDSINIDKGNSDVIDAATDSEVETEYIKE